MDKLILFLLMSSFYMMLYALQTDEELAMHALFQGKHAVNRAVHAAALQLDEEKLARGIHAIDAERARQTAYTYLQYNLQLDQQNFPKPGTFLKERVEVLEFAVINGDEFQFPYRYVHPPTNYEVVLARPGVVMIVQLHFPRTYRVLGPITWELKGAAELVY